MRSAPAPALQNKSLNSDLRTKSKQEPHPSASSAPTDNDHVVPTRKPQFFVIFTALILAVFCVALDNTIIVTAISHITDNYTTLGDVGWSVDFLAGTRVELLSLHYVKDSQ